MNIFVSRILPVGIAALFAVGCASTQPEPAKSETKPVAEAKPAAPASTAQSSNMASYNVVRGDNLWGISSKPTIYGNPYSWPLIFKANRDKIKDADLIETGWVLSVDKNPSSADVNAAVKHAKTRGEWSVGRTEKSDLDFLASYGVK